MRQEFRNRCFASAQRVAACPHLTTCRSELSAAGKEMPLPLPSPDFVGSRYRGLVIVAGNPGIAHAGVQHHNDAIMFDLQQRVGAGDQDAFEQLMVFLPESMLHWPQVVNAAGRERMGYDIEEIAYVELVKCATRPLGSDLRGLLRGTDILSRCWETHTRAMLALLQPTHIVALWKPIIPTLEHLGYQFSAQSRIGYHSGARSFTLEQRYAHAKPVFDHFYGRV